jgi:magnesium chelatase accessory protein
MLGRGDTMNSGLGSNAGSARCFDRPIDSFVQAGGLTWRVQKLGRGPSIVMIHGTASSVHTWADVAPLLSMDYSLTMFDLPGHGLSEPLAAHQMSLESIASRAGDLLSTLGMTPEILIGHSAGASIAAQMLVEGRITRPRGIIALNGALLPFTGVASWLYPVAAKLLSVTRIPARLFARRAAQEGAADRIIRSTGSRLGSQSVSEYQRLFSKDAHVQAALDMMTAWDLSGLNEALPKIDTPMHLIACSEDLAVPPEQAIRLREMTPRAEVHYVRGLGHLAHEEAPDRIGELLQGLCRRLLEDEPLRRSVGA